MHLLDKGVLDQLKIAVPWWNGLRLARIRGESPDNQPVPGERNTANRIDAKANASQYLEMCLGKFNKDVLPGVSFCPAWHPYYRKYSYSSI